MRTTNQSDGTQSPAERIPEARYAYYRRCQVFRRNGVQCKAPAETGSHICHAHAGQLATAVRRERERQAVLVEAVAEMRRQGRTECKMADLFMDFKGINVTLAVMARALINGRIDCKTAGQMVVHLQTCSKLLWQIHRRKTSTTESRRHGEDQKLPQICADERRLSTEKTLTTKDTRSTPLSQAQGRSGQATEHEGLRLIHSYDAELKEQGLENDWSVMASARCADHSPGAGAMILQFADSIFGDRCRGHDPPELKAA